jgi:hypothetical protein
MIRNKTAMPKEDVFNSLSIYARIAGDQSVKKRTLARNIEKILSEDKMLLERLAK